MYGFNWIDIVAVLLIAVYVATSTTKSLIIRLSEIIGFIVTLLLAFFVYPFLSNILITYFDVFRSPANIASFVFSFMLFQVGYYAFFRLTVRRYEDRFKGYSRYWMNRTLCILQAFVLAVAMVSLLLSILVALPFSDSLQTDIVDSNIGGQLFRYSGFLAMNIETRLIGHSPDDLLAFLAISSTDPSIKKLSLSEASVDREIDISAEKTMLDLINETRKENDLDPLEMDRLLRKVARSNSSNMWDKDYYATDSSKRVEVAKRIANAGVIFDDYGENLALAPEENIAHRGFMNDPNKRKAILDPDFKRIGIGIVSAGMYGSMFTQEFAD